MSAAAPAPLDAQRGSAVPPATTQNAELRTVDVRVNGRALPGAQVLAEKGAEVVYVPIQTLRQLVDGEGSHAQSRFQLRDGRLYATRPGGCNQCPLQVRRAVLVSEEVRLVGREPHISLESLVRALEGRLEVDREAKAYLIFAGRCSWCILEPR